MRRAIQQLPATLLGFLRAKGWVWKVAIAGLCGSATHSLLMFAKAQLGILESFHPYHSLQVALTYWTGEYVHPVVPWLLSYLNGSTAAGFAFCPPLRASAGQQRSDEGVHFRRSRMVGNGFDFLSTAGARPIRDESRPGLLTRAVFARDDADVQRRDGHCLQHDRCWT